MDFDRKTARATAKVFISLIVICLTVALLAQEEGATEEPDAISYRDLEQTRGEDGAFILGSPDAEIKIIVFSDVLCPTCVAYESTIDAVIEQFVATGQAQLEYRLVPYVDPDLSVYAATIAECAGEEGAFWPARNVLATLAAEGNLDAQAASIVFDVLDLNFGSVSGCVPAAEQFITDSMFANEVGVSSVPAVRVQINDEPIANVLVDSVNYAQGPVPLDVLETLVISDDPAALTFPANQLRSSRMLADDSLLVDDEGCEIPCWRGITPGQTTVEDAVAILESDPQLVDVEVSDIPGSTAVIAAWKAQGGDLCCELVSRDGEVVSFVRLLLTPDVTLGELLGAHSEPDYLTGSPITSDQAIMSLVYPDIQTIVNIFVAGANDGQLREGSEIIGVQYITPEDMQAFIERQPLHEWDGLLSFAEYMEGEVEVNPPTP